MKPLVRRAQVALPMVLQANHVVAALHRSRSFVVGASHSSSRPTGSLPQTGYAHADNSWCVVYGAGIDQTPGADWTSDSHAATVIGPATKPNPSYICVEPQTVGAFRPNFFPVDVAPPLAYYFMNEGSGWGLRDSVSGNANAGLFPSPPAGPLYTPHCAPLSSCANGAAGTVVYVDSHQKHPDGTSIAHGGPNWQQAAAHAATHTRIQ